MAHRRDFLQTLGMMGISLPVLQNALARQAASSSTAAAKALILCSRAEYWAKKVLPPAWSAYQASGNILDGIEAGGNVCELDPEDTSVGYGGLPDERGIVTLDASFMYGPTHKCGSVANMQNIKKACSVARLVMERTDHALIVGQGAFDFARAHGFPSEDLLTEQARLTWLEWKENLSDKDDWLAPKDKDYYRKLRKGGTINILGMSDHGEIAGSTTTSGLFGKIHGRVGDSPIIGAGLYLDNEVGAAGATGRGEELLRTCGSFLLVEKMKAGRSPQQACEDVIERIFYVNGGKQNVDFNCKMVAFNKDGEVGCASILGEDDGLPYASIITADGIKVVPGKAMK
jgi:N4-(beta-N-acetylglucosaminyl)-L-asparaginase